MLHTSRFEDVSTSSLYSGTLWSNLETRTSRAQMSSPWCGVISHALWLILAKSGANNSVLMLLAHIKIQDFNEQIKQICENIICMLYAYIYVMYNDGYKARKRMCMDLTVFYNFNWVFSTNARESCHYCFLQGPVQPASTVHRNPSCPTAHSDSHHPCMEPLRCLPFLRLSATVMFFLLWNSITLSRFYSSSSCLLTNRLRMASGNPRKTYSHRRPRKTAKKKVRGTDRMAQMIDIGRELEMLAESGMWNRDTVHNQICLPFTSLPFVSSSPLFAWRLRVYWIEFFDFHSLRTECNQTTAPSATLHQISSLKCFAKWLRSLLRKLFELFQKYEMSRPSQLGSVLCVSARAGKWEEWELEGTAERKSLLKVPLPSGSRMVHSEAPARSKPLRRSIERGAAGTLASNTEIRTF